MVFHGSCRTVILPNGLERIATGIFHRCCLLDFIDIYKVQSIQEIFDFFAHPTPFCKYCDIDKSIYNGKWEKSRKEITEWTEIWQ